MQAVGDPNSHITALQLTNDIIIDTIIRILNVLDIFFTLQFLICYFYCIKLFHLIKMKKYNC